MIQTREEFLEALHRDREDASINYLDMNGFSGIIAHGCHDGYCRGADSRDDLLLLMWDFFKKTERFMFELCQPDRDRIVAQWCDEFENLLAEVSRRLGK